jgi:hypothetical protein
MLFWGVAGTHMQDADSRSYYNEAEVAVTVGVWQPTSIQCRPCVCGSVIALANAGHLRRRHDTAVAAIQERQGHS